MSGRSWSTPFARHLADEPGVALDVLFDGENEIELSAARHDTPHTHGTGDTLAAATTAALARGVPLEQAVRDGKAFVTSAVSDSYPLGAGLGPVGHFWRVHPVGDS